MPIFAGAKQFSALNGRFNYFCRMTRLEEAQNRMNQLGSNRTPFLFVFDFLMSEPLVIPLHEINPAEILYSLPGNSNAGENHFSSIQEIDLQVFPVERSHYQSAFTLVMSHLRRGDSYLLNLTKPVQVRCKLGLKEIFYRSQAPYKLWIKDRFTVFSPESFVKMQKGKIFTYPMKGTLDASLPDAEQKLLSNEKELAEHYTIVDLLRNDLNRVATDVKVERFRYVETIETNRGKLLQTSSLISGTLPDNAFSQLGDLFLKLLPAGSVTGAPKKKTIEIILEAEQYTRGFYTGVFGLFNGESVDSAVLIRFIEETENGLVFKAGGGITVNSRCEDEYNELLEKVYLPIR